MTDDHAAALDALAQYAPAAYRAARWQAIERAREAGASWYEVGLALSTDPSGARRYYRQDAPDDDAPTPGT